LEDNLEENEHLKSPPTLTLINKHTHVHTHTHAHAHTHTHKLASQSQLGPEHKQTFQSRGPPKPLWVHHIY